MSEKIRIWVPGIPRPGGSKKAFFIKSLGRAVITEDNKRSKDWRNSVAFMAADHIKTPLSGALEVSFLFVMPRPKGHYGTGRYAGMLKASAPKYPTTKPDITKLIRSTEDAMKGIAWGDDSQVAHQDGYKAYGDNPGCTITIRMLDESACENCESREHLLCNTQPNSATEESQDVNHHETFPRTEEWTLF